MKHLIILTVLFSCLFTNSASANDINIPTVIKHSFNVSFPKAESVKWSESNEYIIASFNVGKGSFHAYYTGEGTLAVVAQDITLSELPEALAKEYNKKFQGLPSLGIYKMESNGEVVYYCDAQKDGNKLLYQSFGRSWSLSYTRK